MQLATIHSDGKFIINGELSDEESVMQTISVESDKHFLFQTSNVRDKSYYSMRTNVPRYMLFDYMVNRNIRYIYPNTENHSELYIEDDEQPTNEAIVCGSITNKFIYTKQRIMK